MVGGDSEESQDDGWAAVCLSRYGSLVEGVDRSVWGEGLLEGAGDVSRL